MMVNRVQTVIQSSHLVVASQTVVTASPLATVNQVTHRLTVGIVQVKRVNVQMIVMKKLFS